MRGMIERADEVINLNADHLAPSPYPSGPARGTSADPPTRKHGTPWPGIE